jgi:hypothetical protein
MTNKMCLFMRALNVYMVKRIVLSNVNAEMFLIEKASRYIATVISLK